jgi:hypothetical protein
MKIPKHIVVNRTPYAISRVRPANVKDALGHINYAKGQIYVATHDKSGNKLATEEVDDAFWHEITHAVLDGMNHPLCEDERFVTRFASILSTAINSAKL